MTIYIGRFTKAPRVVQVVEIGTVTKKHINNFRRFLNFDPAQGLNSPVHSYLAEKQPRRPRLSYGSLFCKPKERMCLFR